MKIGNIKIGHNEPPFVIAEMSANHNGDINNAYKIINMAKKAGAHSIKLQTYKPDTITMNMRSEEFMIEGGLWDGRNLYELYQGAHMPWEWQKSLFDYAKEIDIIIFSSPFDNTAVDMLEDLNCPAYKIASFEAIDLPLIKYVAGTGKPLIISTGMANKEEIHEAINAARDGGCNNLAILHCVSGYPTPSNDYNLKTISDMRNEFGVVTGLSDHTVDNFTAFAGVALGAAIIEKHVTLNRNGGGPDDSFSLEFEDLQELCKGARIAWQSVGQVDYGLKSSEKGSIKFRRSLYFVKDIAAGEEINENHIRSIRPGFGLAPKYFDSLIGRVVKMNIKKGTRTEWSHLEKLT